VRPRVEPGGLKRVPDVFEGLPQRGRVARGVRQPIDRVHAEPDPFHVECGDGAPERLRFLRQLRRGDRGRQSGEDGQQRVELRERGSGAFRHRNLR